MDKKTLLIYIKVNIATDFQEDGKYANIENSARIFEVLNNLTEDVAYDRLLDYLFALKNLGVNDTKLDNAIMVVQNNMSMEEKLESLIIEKRQKGKYDASDMVIVRVTDHFPISKQVPAICNVPFVCKSGSQTGSALYKIIAANDEILKDLNEKIMIAPEYSKEQYELLQQRNDREDELHRIATELNHYSTQYRSSVHFCLNGVVTNHSKGTFDGGIVIIEPFVEHENDTNILGVRPDDTFFKNSLKLSDKAVILVPEKDKESLINIPNLDSYNIIYYSGDRNFAIKQTLINMGIVPEEVEEHNIKDSPTAQYIRDYIKSKGYPQDPHIFCENYKEDDAKSLVLWHMYENEFFNYLLLFINDDNLKNKLAYVMQDFYSDKIDLLVEIINSIGLEEYTKIVNQFNSTVLSKISEGNYPTNEELINNEKELNIMNSEVVKLQ